MVSVDLIERRGAVLTPSALACLSGVPTVNISSGCAHGCIYCYTRGYSQHPGEGTVRVYRDTASRVARELARKRREPASVYFCPSCDAFQPVEAVLDQSYAAMAAVLEAGVGVEFVTKGTVPERFLNLFVCHPGHVACQVGLTTLDEGLRRQLEPGAATVDERLQAIARLKDVGASVSVRADPLIHGVTDGEANLAALVAACRDRGVADLAASYLFLRPAVTASIKRHVADAALAERILSPYSEGVRFRLRGGASGGLALPEVVRREGFDRLKQLVADAGLHVHLCGCKNPDLTAEHCHLTRAAAPQQTASTTQRLLWDARPASGA